MLVQIRLIFQPVYEKKSVPRPLLAYVQYFTPVHWARHANDRRKDVPLVDADLVMYKVRRVRRSDGTPKGDIILLSEVWQAVSLTPVYDEETDSMLTCNNSLDLPKFWHINSFSDKHVYQTVY